MEYGALTPIVPRDVPDPNGGLPTCTAGREIIVIMPDLDELDEIITAREVAEIFRGEAVAILVREGKTLGTGNVMYLMTGCPSPNRLQRRRMPRTRSTQPSEPAPTVIGL
jgi:hypothetical protein